MKRLGIGLLGVVILLLSDVASGRSAAPAASIQRSAQRIRGLKLKKNEAPVDARGAASIAVEFTPLGRSLIVRDNPIVTGGGKKPVTTSFRVDLSGRITLVPLLAVDKEGAVEQETLTLIHEKAPEPAAVSAPREIAAQPAPEPAQLAARVPESVAPIGLSTSLGFSYLSYRQTWLSDFSQSGVDAKVRYDRSLGNDWTAGAQLSLTLLPFAPSGIDAKARVLTLGASATRFIPLAGETWGLFAGAAGSYRAMIGTEDKFGYANLGGTGPVLGARFFRSANTLSLAFRYTFLNERFFSFRLSDREIAAAASFQRSLGAVDAFLVSLEVANARQRLSRSEIESTISTLSAGYLF